MVVRYLHYLRLFLTFKFSYGILAIFAICCFPAVCAFGVIVALSLHFLGHFCRFGL